MRIPPLPYAGPLAVIASNAVLLVGVFALGWTASALLGVFVLELAAVLFWTAVKIPFAAKRPNNAMGAHRLLGPVQAKRGGIGLLRPLPDVYLRNLPTLAVTVVLLAPVELGAAFLVFALSEPVVTTETTGQILLGGVSVFVGRGVETATHYFRDGGYRDHSPRSVLLIPFKHVFAVGTLIFVAGSFDVTSTAVLALIVGGKVIYDLRAIQVDRDDDKRGIFYRLYGSAETEITPVRIAEPDAEPIVRIRPTRLTRVADALYRGFTYTVTSGVLLLYVIGALLATFAPLRLAAYPLVVILALAALRAGSWFLRYGTLEFRCYEHVLVAYDTWLDEPQQRIERGDVTAVSVNTDLVDRAFGTATVEFERPTGDGSEIQLTVPDPEDVERDDSEGSMTVPHVENPSTVADALGVGWQYERDVGAS
ncbi:DUF6498-containing protein [Halobellus captivus]|uniref:DUF6498-containing protein n=1 Tax=Halobellus captivus TaxID=2592614 RepID=UPI00119F49E3|nr:DUF6498-containing protein [Halobellus captivus]